jgi:hypothetical protein
MLALCVRLCLNSVKNELSSITLLSEEDMETPSDMSES